ncbi:MAG: helix-turn-helix domain-containing protein, partial [Planctomycetes bacterium]|nr:helix-turn-helix domain-containing protein [Planctomycetota bacterium]
MVRNITYRLKSILRRLLKAPEPVPVKDLADDLRISRRTVFRELANTETLQHSYGLSIGSKPGEGIYIDGDEKGRESLSKTLNRMGGDEPKDRSERQLRLMIELLEEAKLQKLVNYADKFGVSVATISNDLDEIETRLSGYNLALSRRSGSGVSIAGEEQGYRRAFLSAVHEMPRILAEFAPDENALINRLDTRVDVGKWMTPHSLNAFEYYLVVALHRYRCGHPLPASEASPGNLPAAESIAAAIAGECGVALSEAEINAISLEITACSINVPTMDKSSKRYSQLLRLAHELIAAFDPTKTPSLDQDDVLIDGLVSYLFSAEIRLRYRVELYDPLAEQMSTGYSEVMEKTRHAAKVLRDIGGGWLPESEISLLATHFGAAVSRLNEQRRRELSVRVGVVCI